MNPSPWDVYVVGLVSIMGLMALIEWAVTLLDVGARVVSGDPLD